MRRRPEAPTFFVDRDLGVHFFEALSADDRFKVEFLEHHFDQDTDDAVWLAHIAAMGWIGVTHDKRIKRDHRSIIAYFKASVIVVVGRKPLAEHAANFVATYPRIERFVRDHSGAYVAKLYHPSSAEAAKLKPKGRIELWGEW